MNDLMKTMSNLIKESYEEQIVETYDYLHLHKRECEDRWKEDIDNDCTYMDFLESSEELDKFYDEHSLIIDNSNWGK
jgi:hypothetical protein